MYKNGEKEIRTETICSISTPVGQGGIGIVRMSGPRSVEIAEKIFVQASVNGRGPARGYSIRYGKVEDPGSRRVVDEVLMTVMRAPKTYTREDVVEINCHSGSVVLRKILKILLSLGARLAEPGEFTKRAFLNGRIDLAQAEAVMALISAKTDMSLKAAMQQLSGELSQEFMKINSMVVHLLSEVEACIDFPDEDLDLIGPKDITGQLSSILREVDRLIESAEKGKILRDGVSTAIVGKANVGKSSLLNRLLMENRAIVTPYPGTTRDVIEGFVNIQGIPLRILDTAGIRDSEDPVEREGIKRSRESIASADLVIMVADLSKGPDGEDARISRVLRKGGKETVLVLNKSDLAKGDLDIEKERFRDIIGEIQPNMKVIASMKTKYGLDGLKKGIYKLILQGRGGFSESAVVTNVRHAMALESTKESLLRVQDGVTKGLSEELLSVDLRAALVSLGQVTGETTADDVLNEIFASFCVGK